MLNKILKDERIPQEWKKSQLIPIYKEKGDPIYCKNYRGIKLLEVRLKILEKVLDRRLREIVQIHGTQYGFQYGFKRYNGSNIHHKTATGKSSGKTGKLFLAFLDLEKAYDRVPRDVVYICLRRRGVSERLMRLVKTTYADTTTRVRTTFGDTEEFRIGVGLHQGLALFILILDTLTEGIRISAPWEFIFADDIVLIGKTEEELKEKLAKWQRELANGGLRMSAEKSETMVMETSQETEIRTKDMNDKDLRQIGNFKHLGTEIESGVRGRHPESCETKNKGGMDEMV